MGSGIFAIGSTATIERRRLSVTLALGLTLACSGNEFTAGSSQCEGAACASGGSAGAGGSSQSGGSGGSTGGSGSSGAGGSNARGGAGGSGTGGSSGSGGNAGGTTGGGGSSGSAGSGGTNAPSFPGTHILDDFNREPGAPGLSWAGSDLFDVTEQQLGCTDCAYAALWSTPFGADQEVFATLSGFGPDAPEINLVLKAQDHACKLVELLYSPLTGEVSVAYCVDNQWYDSTPLEVDLEPGDQLGGRASASGNLEIFVNGVFAGERDISAFPYESGHIGVNGISGDGGLRWDDFGGGDVQ